MITAAWLTQQGPLSHWLYPKDRAPSHQLAQGVNSTFGASSAPSPPEEILPSIGNGAFWETHEDYMDLIPSGVVRFPRPSSVEPRLHSTSSDLLLLTNSHWSWLFFHVYFELGELGLGEGSLVVVGLMGHSSQARSWLASTIAERPLFKVSLPYCHLSSSSL